MPMKTFLREYGMALLSMLCVIFLICIGSPVSKKVQAAMTDVVNEATAVNNIDDLEIVKDGTIGTYNGKKVVEATLSCSKNASNDDLSKQKDLFTVTVTYKDGNTEKVLQNNILSINKKTEDEDGITYTATIKGDKKNFDTSELIIPKITPVYAGYNSSDTTLYFAKTEKEIKDAGIDLTGNNYYGDISKVKYNSIPWYSMRYNLTKVNFLSEVKPTSCAYWFNNLPYLTWLKNIKNLNTCNMTDMSFMFSSCCNLTALNVSNFDTSKVTNMDSMFYDCSRLASLDVSHFDTSKVTNMHYMFNGCRLLTTLDVGNFNTSKVTNMKSMFFGCTSLTSLDVSNFNSSKVTDMSSMFYYCSSLTTLKLGCFNTSKAYYSNIFEHMNTNAMLYTYSQNTKDWILNLSSDNRPSAWTTNNIIVQ